MRRYDIVSAILLILSIIDFALAAPVLVQEKRQASVDVVHIPKDVPTVFGKRGVTPEELIKLVEERLKTWGKPVESDSHSSSSSAPPEPDHGLTNVVQSPTPSPASSTANPDPLMEPSSSSAAIPDSFEDRYNTAWDNAYLPKGSGSDTSLKPMFSTSPGYGSDDDLERATVHAPKVTPISIPAVADPTSDWNDWRNVPSSPNTGPSTGADPAFDWNYWMNLEDPAPPAGHVQKPNPGPSESTGADPNFDWDYWMSSDDLLASAPRPVSTKETGPARWGTSTSEAHQQPPPYPLSSPEFDKDHDGNPPSPAGEPSPTSVYWYPGSPAPPSLPDARLPTMSEHEDLTPPSPNLGSPKEPENEVVPGPPPSPDPELHSDDQSSTADSQPDLEAAIYAAKGKAKQLRSISGTARDVGNAAQRELRPTERSLDPRDLAVRNPGNF